jgi:hypothetical protein
MTVPLVNLNILYFIKTVRHVDLAANSPSSHMAPVESGYSTSGLHLELEVGKFANMPIPHVLAPDNDYMFW